MTERKVSGAEGFDRVLEEVGTFGWFQAWVLLCMTFQALLSWHHLSAVFLAAKPEHWCEIPELKESNWTAQEIRELSIPKLDNPEAFDSCNQYDLDYSNLLQLSGGSFPIAVSLLNRNATAVKPCSSGWTWDDSIYSSTAVTEFQLFCDRKYYVGAIQGTYMFGVLIGSLIFGSLSDQLLGRRNSILLCLIISLLGGFGSALVYSFEAFLLLRILLAAGVAGCYQNCYVLMLEYANSKARAELGLLGQVSFAVGYMLLALFGYLFRGWRELQLWLTAAGVVLISYYWVLPESARWLLYRGDYDKACKTLSNVARINRKEIPEKAKILQIFHFPSNPSTISSQNGNTASQQEKSGSGSGVLKIIKVGLENYWNLLKTREIRKRTLVIWSLFVIVDLVYYGVVFDSATLTKDPFMLVFLAGLMEVPSYTLVIPCLTYLGRKPTVVGTFLLTAVCSFIVVYTPLEYETMRVTISMFGKLFITTCFAVLYLLGAELFPTSTRTTGLASAVIMGRLGSILAPFVVDIVKTSHRELPNIIFGVVSILAGLFSLLLPETKDTEMLDDISELEKVCSIANEASANKKKVVTSGESTEHNNEHKAI